MFSHEGPARDPRQNAVLAGYLALVAGFVNSSGYVIIGSFTSHVTGSVGRMASDIATHEVPAALFAALLVLMFMAGAFLASLILEAGRTAHSYGMALLAEAGLLLAFVFVAGLAKAQHPRALDAEAAILCLAMGMQNSLVTRLSGAVIRTTHLTGVATDLGIELARWYRWHRAKLKLVPELLPGRERAARPSMAKTILLGTIGGAFTTGAVTGAVMTLKHGRWSMFAPALAVLLASTFAFASRDGEQPQAQPQPAPPPPTPQPQPSAQPQPTAQPVPAPAVASVEPIDAAREKRRSAE